MRRGHETTGVRPTTSTVRDGDYCPMNACLDDRRLVFVCRVPIRVAIHPRGRDRERFSNRVSGHDLDHACPATRFRRGGVWTRCEVGRAGQGSSTEGCLRQPGIRSGPRDPSPTESQNLRTTGCLCSLCLCRCSAPVLMWCCYRCDGEVIARSPLCDSHCRAPGVTGWSTRITRADVCGSVAYRRMMSSQPGRIEPRRSSQAGGRTPKRSQAGTHGVGC